MIDTHQQISSRIVLTSFLFVAVGIQLAMIAAMPIIVTYDTIGLLSGIRGNPFPGFPILATITGVVKFDTVIYLLACQGVLSVLICLAPIHLTLQYTRPVVAITVGIVLLLTLVPFVFSTWLMNDHLYMFSLVALVWSYGMLLLSGHWRYAICLAGALWLAQITRPTGAMLFAVVGLAVVMSFFVHRGQIQPRISRLVMAGVLFGVLLIVGGRFLQTSARSEPVSDGKGRWLFCQIYSQSSAKGHTQVMLEGAPSLDVMAAALRKRLVEKPTILTALIARWPEYYGRYEADGARLAEDIIHNRQPIKESEDHKFCWVIFSVLDESFGADRANSILIESWRALLWAHPSVIGSIYMHQLGAYFFSPPDYRNVTLYSNDIGTSILGPRTYAEIYGVGVLAEKSVISKKTYRYVFFVWLLTMPILSLLALLSLFVIFSRRHYAPVLIFCFGIVSYHGLATAISNIVDDRYVFIIYPELIVLATAGLLACLWFIRNGIVQRARSGLTAF